MTLNELDDFIQERDEIFRALKQGKITERERVLARTVKLMEEVGELSDEILASLGDQRKTKLEGRTPEGIPEELADVIITTFLLAKAVNADIPAALEKKMKKIRERNPEYGAEPYQPE